MNKNKIRALKNLLRTKARKSSKQRPLQELLHTFRTITKVKILIEAKVIDEDKVLNIDKTILYMVDRPKYLKIFNTYNNFLHF